MEYLTPSLTPNPNDAARNVLGDTSKESAAAAVVTDEFNLINPEVQEPKKRGRKPGSTLTPKAPVNLPPTPGQMMIAESLVEGQALAISGTAALFSTPESANAMYELHVKKYKEKLVLAFATLAKEYGIEVSGKAAALSLLIMVEVEVCRACYAAWIPKEELESEPGKDKK